mmetsp:Transcript_15223/g.33318  ORF Transcript_15223/g.33318 Transcript_15223/m.33318 type:complete len:233 (-) Transcript_15223:279-977(-)
MCMKVTRENSSNLFDRIWVVIKVGVGERVDPMQGLVLATRGDGIVKGHSAFYCKGLFSMDHAKWQTMFWRHQHGIVFLPLLAIHESYLVAIVAHQSPVWITVVVDSNLHRHGGIFRNGCCLDHTSLASLVVKFTGGNPFLGWRTTPWKQTHDKPRSLDLVILYRHGRTIGCTETHTTSPNSRTVNRFLSRQPFHSRIQIFNLAFVVLVLAWLPLALPVGAMIQTQTGKSMTG